jgi:hypothetical protein
MSSAVRSGSDSLAERLFEVQTNMARLLGEFFLRGSAVRFCRISGSSREFHQLGLPTRVGTLVAMSIGVILAIGPIAQGASVIAFRRRSMPPTLDAMSKAAG